MAARVVDRPKHRRLILPGIVLLAGGVLLLWRPWTSTTEPLGVVDGTITARPIEPEANRSEPPPPEATAPAASVSPTASTAGGIFRGRVLDAVTRQPVPEFEVQLVGVPRGHIRGNEPRVTQTFASADGRFVWQQAPAGDWNIRVAASRYQHFHAEGVGITAGKTTPEIVMPLRRGHLLKGRVFDQVSGAGIADAWVTFRDPGTRWRSMGSTRQRFEKSKKDGTFVIDGVPGGDMIVMAGAQDHASREVAVVVNEQTPRVEIGLATGAKIAGMVLAPDGTPAKGHVMLDGPDIGFAKELDETGTFSFEHRPAGRFQLRANTHAGNARLDLELAENEIREGIVLQVVEGRSVRGVIRGLRPEVLEKTFISVHSESKREAFTAKPNEQGAYIVKGVPPGRAQIIVYATMSRQSTRSFDMPADQDVVLDIVLPPGGRLSGRVTQDARPVANRHISLASAGSKSDTWYQAETAQDGRYEIEGVPPGEYRISIGQDASRVVTIAGDAVVNIDIPLVQLAGRIVEDGGTVPIVGAGVHLIGSEPQTAQVRNYKQADDFGQFRLTGIEQGEIVLTVYQPGYEMHRETISYSSPITNKTISLRKSAGVEVRARASRGEEVGPLYVSETMPGSEYGIGLWIPVNAEGIGYLPSGLAGSTLTIQRSDSNPIVIKEWDGQSLDLKFEGRQ